MRKSIKAVLRWPSNDHNDFVPWWVILWRLLWLPVWYLGRGLCAFAILVTQGWIAAVQQWRESY